MKRWIPIRFRQGLRQPTADTELLVQKVSGKFHLSMNVLSAVKGLISLLLSDKILIL